MEGRQRYGGAGWRRDVKNMDEKSRRNFSLANDLNFNSSQPTQTPLSILCFSDTRSRLIFKLNFFISGIVFSHLLCHRSSLNNSPDPSLHIYYTSRFGNISIAAVDFGRRSIQTTLFEPLFWLSSPYRRVRPCGERTMLEDHYKLRLSFYTLLYSLRMIDSAPRYPRPNPLACRRRHPHVALQ